VTGVLAYDPLRLATLATNAQAAADDLTAVGGDEPFVVDAVGICHSIAADLDETLLTALRAALSSTAMTEWNGTALMSVDALIDALTTQALTWQAADPSAPFVLGPGDFSLAAAITPGEQAQWLHDVNPACVLFAGGSYLGGGYVTDPNGDRWPIVVSRVVTDDGDVYTSDELPVSSGQPSVATLGGSDPGWEVVGYATGIERFQEAPSVADTILGALGGTTGQVGPLPPNSGLALIAMPASGPPHLVTEPLTPGPLVAMPTAGVPDPADSSPGAIVEGGTALAVTVAHGGVMAAAMDNQTQRAYRAVFEGNADGRRRVRIETFTLAHDGDGDVVIVPEHVYVDADGDLMSQTISYGNPYQVDGVYIGGSNDDVAEFAFSGNEPISYPVPRAVFP
jgi:hypothetical protein